MHWTNHALNESCIEWTMHWMNHALNEPCIEWIMHWMNHALNESCIEWTSLQDPLHSTVEELCWISSGSSQLHTASASQKSEERQASTLDLNPRIFLMAAYCRCKRFRVYFPLNPYSLGLIHFFCWKIKIEIRLLKIRIICFFGLHEGFFQAPGQSLQPSRKNV